MTNGDRERAIDHDLLARLVRRPTECWLPEGWKYNCTSSYGAEIFKGGHCLSIRYDWEAVEAIALGRMVRWLGERGWSYDGGEPGDPDRYAWTRGHRGSRNYRCVQHDTPIEAAIAACELAAKEQP